MLVSAIGYWFFPYLLVFFVYRLAGYLIVLSTRQFKYFILFPNFFDFLYLWFFLDFFYASFSSSPAFSLTILFALKICQEIWIYLIWPNHLRHHGYPRALAILGQKREVDW